MGKANQTSLCSLYLLNKKSYITYKCPSSSKRKVNTTTRTNLSIFTSPESAPSPTRSSLPRTNSVQINIGQVDESGRYTGRNLIYAFSGFIRKQGRADAELEELLTKAGLYPHRD